MKKISWRRNSGDDIETYDSYLWIDGEPTDHLVSQASGVYYGYINDKEFGMFDSLKEAKQAILKELGLN